MPSWSGTLAPLWTLPSTTKPSVSRSGGRLLPLTRSCRLETLSLLALDPRALLGLPCELAMPAAPGGGISSQLLPQQSRRRLVGLDLLLQHLIRVPLLGVEPHQGLQDLELLAPPPPLNLLACEGHVELCLYLPAYDPGDLHVVPLVVPSALTGPVARAHHPPLVRPLRSAPRFEVRRGLGPRRRPHLVKKPEVLVVPGGSPEPELLRAHPVTSLPTAS